MQAMLLVAGLALAVTPLHAADFAGASGPQRPTGTIAFASLAPRGWDVYITDVGTHQTRRLTDLAALDYNASFSPDGRWIAFVSERDGNMELYTVREDGTGLRRLTDEFGLDDHPAWSPDGKRIAFVSTRQPADTVGRAWNSIYIMNADGSDVRRLSPADAADYSPTWSPREDWIAFASGSGKPGQTDLFVMKPDGSGRRMIVKDGGWPSFAADGRSLYFHSERQGGWGIWRIDLDGSHLERITPPDVEAHTPQASADGRWLALTVRRGEHRQIARMDLDTRKIIPVTDEPTDHWNPSISRTAQKSPTTESLPASNPRTWRNGERRPAPACGCFACRAPSRPFRRTAGSWPSSAAASPT